MPFKRFAFDQKFNGALIDTNLLLLVLVGLFDRSLIGKFKRTQTFESDDFDKLIGIIANCNGCLYTTPNILTELTNLTDNDTLNKNNTFFQFLYNFIDQFVEINVDSKTIVRNNEIAFIKLGLTDASIMNAATEDILIVTDDLSLYQFLSLSSKPAINYNHLRFL